MDPKCGRKKKQTGSLRMSLQPQSLHLFPRALRCAWIKTWQRWGYTAYMHFIEPEACRTPTIQRHLCHGLNTFFGGLSLHTPSTTLMTIPDHPQPWVVGPWHKEFMHIYRFMHDLILLSWSNRLQKGKKANLIDVILLLPDRIVRSNMVRSICCLFHYLESKCSTVWHLVM